MRVLSISALPPYPPDTGLRNRSWHLLSGLADHADVTVVTWADVAVPDEHVQRMREQFDELVLLPLRTTSRSTLARARRQVAFFGGSSAAPYAREMLEQRGLHHAHGRAALADAVRERHLQAPFDVMVMEEEALALAPLPIDVPVVVSRHNVFTEILRDLRMRRWPTRQVWRLEHSSWTRFDRAASGRAVLSVTPTTESALALRRLMPGHRVEAVMNGVTIPAEPVRRGRDVVFVGWMGYPANVDAVCWLVSEIWPRVHATHPDSRLRIIGREPTKAVRDLASRPGVVVTGEVPDIAAASAGAAAAVVPLRAGMGIKTKTLECMALGLPVVSTRIGAEGVCATEDDGLLVRRDARAIADALNALLDDEPRAAASGAAARRHVRRYDWPAAADTYARLLESACGSARPHGRALAR